MKMVVLTLFHWLHRKLEGCYFLSTRKCCHDEGGAGAWGGDVRCFSTVISGMFGLLEKCKESEGVLSRVQGYGRRGVIRKAPSRAGKFKDHDGKGVRFYP